MATARKPRVSTRIRRTSGLQGPRAPMHLVERMQVAVIGLVNAYIDRLMREIDPALRQRFDRVDPLPIGDVSGQVSLGEQFLKTTFHAVDRQAADDLSRAVPIPSSSVLKNSAVLEKAWVKNNTELIQLESRARAEVQRVVTGPLKEGVRVEQVRDLIQARLGVVRSRAELIARDQTLKLYGQIQEARQTEAGITEYTWSTSEDERVRPDHQALDGTTQRWDDPPIVDQRSGRREHPGRDFQCRCAGIPVLPLDGLSEEDNPQEPEPISPTPPEEEQEQELGPEPAAEADPLSGELERQAAEAEAEAARVAAEQRRLELQAQAEAEAARRQEEARRAEAERIRAEEERRRLEAERRQLESQRAEQERRRLQSEAEAERKRQAKKPDIQRYADRVIGGTPEMTDRIAAHLQSVGADRYFEKNGVRTLSSIYVNAPDIPPGASGYYALRTHQLSVKDSGIVHKYAPELGRATSQVVFVKGMSDFDVTLTHEFGHVIHMNDAPNLTMAENITIDNHITEDWERAVREGTAVSKYAEQDPLEHFAEAFTAYQHRKAELHRLDPKTFSMVEYVLRTRGVL